MAINKTNFKRFFKLVYDFSKRKDIFLTYEKNMQLILMELISAELTKEVPFEGMNYDFQPRKHYDKFLPVEEIKVHRLCREIHAQFNYVPFTIGYLWVYRDMINFTNSKDDQKIMESCLFDLIEKGMVEVVEYQHATNGKSWHKIAPSIAKKSTRFSAKRDKFYKSELSNIKKGNEDIKKNLNYKVNKKITVGRYDEQD